MKVSELVRVLSALNMDATVRIDSEWGLDEVGRLYCRGDVNEVIFSPYENLEVLH